MSKHNTIISSVVNKNLPKIVGFYRKKFNVKFAQSKINKISINCPYCVSDSKHPRGDTKFHLVLNLDWGIGKCFHCGAVKPIPVILKHFNVYNEYIDLLQELTDYSLYELQSLLKQDQTKTYKERSDSIKDFASEFILKNGLNNITEMKYALEYANKRVFNNSAEISAYYADEKYLYIPIYRNKNIVAFIARLYLEDIDFPRYKYIKLDPESNPIAFIDEVEENISSDTIYITEGYFDAYAINSSFLDYRAVAIFSKNNTSKVIENLYSVISPDTKIVIVLDSEEKDSNIRLDIDNMLEKLKRYFSNINICILPYGDPNSIYCSKGPRELLDILESRTLNSGEYIKSRIMKISITEIKSREVDVVKLPKFLINLRNKKLSE